jgi:hypothetical protein
MGRQRKAEGEVGTEEGGADEAATRLQSRARIHAPTSYVWPAGATGVHACVRASTPATSARRHRPTTCPAAVHHTYTHGAHRPSHRAQSWQVGEQVGSEAVGEQCG